MDLPIETKRLQLRKYRRSDVSDVIRYSSHPSIKRIINWTTKGGEITEQSVEEFIEAQSQIKPGDLSWMDLAVTLKSNDRVIGAIGIICQKHRQGKIGWALSVEHRGQGLATEAARGLLGYGFLELDLHRIYAETTMWNERSWKLMARLGMRREARYIESEVTDGSWTDGLIYAMLESEWIERREHQDQTTER